MLDGEVPGWLGRFYTTPAYLLNLWAAQLFWLLQRGVNSRWMFAEIKKRVCIVVEVAFFYAAFAFPFHGTFLQN